jgi:hypothetical protein
MARGTQLAHQRGKQRTAGPLAFLFFFSFLLCFSFASLIVCLDGLQN